MMNNHIERHLEMYVKSVLYVVRGVFFLLQTSYITIRDLSSDSKVDHTRTVKPYEIPVSARTTNNVQIRLKNSSKEGLLKKTMLEKMTKIDVFFFLEG